jgi:cysteine/O-acetylserine efflux protein
VTSGFLIIMLACATLSSLLGRVLPAATPWLRGVGSVYILWLAFSVYRNSDRLLSDPGRSKPLRFLNGFALQFVNPKAAFFGLTVYSAFLQPWLGTSSALRWSPLVLASVTFAAVSTWALGGHLVRTWINTPGRARALGVILALALVYTAVDLSGVFPR